MESFEEKLKQFHADMDITLKDLTPSKELKKRVLIAAHAKFKANKVQKRMISFAASFACILVFIGVFQIPSVRAQAILTLSDIVTWVRETTNIPVYLPDSWQPIQQAPDANTQNYYYEVQGSKDSYNINIYRTKVPVKFNDESDLLEKNGPVSKSDFVGSITGELITNYTQGLSNSIPKSAESLALISGVKAYSANNGTSLWWVESGWNFEFVGSSLSQNTLKDLAMAWNINHTQIPSSGKVSIVEGNGLTFCYMWNKEGYRYTFTTNSTDFSATMNVLGSFSKINLDQ